MTIDQLLAATIENPFASLRKTFEDFAKQEREAGWQAAIRCHAERDMSGWSSHKDEYLYPPDTKHLDTAIGLLKSTNRPKVNKLHFTLQVFPKTPTTKAYALLQNYRGKTVQALYGDDCKKQAEEHIATIPGATMSSFFNG